MPMKKPLSEVATIFPGLSILQHHRQGPGGQSVPVINVGDLEAGRGVDQLPNLVLRIGPKVDRYRVAKGDVLVTARGTQLKVASVGREAVGAIASSNLIVVRPGPDLLPGVLLT